MKILRKYNEKRCIFVSMQFDIQLAQHVLFTISMKRKLIKQAHQIIKLAINMKFLI